MSALVEVTAPTTYPVTLLSVKDHLRIGHSDEDDVLSAYIGAATAEAQVWCNRQFVTATYDWFLDGFPGGGCPFYVPRAPLSSVTSLKYVDENGTQQTWSSSNYRVDTNSAPGRITEAYDVVWPSIRDVTNAVEIRFVCGYGAYTAVPEAVAVAIRMLVGDLYERRESRLDLRIEDNPVVYRLLASERLPEFR